MKLKLFWRFDGGPALVFTVFGLIFLALGIFIIGRTGAIQRDGIITIAEVISRDSETRQIRRTQAEAARVETTLYLRLRFTPMSGEVVEMNKPVTTDRFMGLREGDEVEVAYLPADPRIFDFPDSTSWILGWLCGGAGVIVTGLGIFWISRILRKVRRKLAQLAD